MLAQSDPIKRRTLYVKLSLLMDAEVKEQLPSKVFAKA